MRSLISKIQNLWREYQVCIYESQILMLRGVRKVAGKQNGQGGVLNIVLIGFIVLLVVFRLVPELASAQADIEADANVSDFTESMTEIGEWLYPLAAIFAVGMLLLRRIR